MIAMSPSLRASLEVQAEYAHLQRPVRQALGTKGEVAAPAVVVPGVAPTPPASARSSKGEVPPEVQRMRRYARLVKSLATQPIDIQWSVGIAEFISRTTARAMFFYQDARSFIIAHLLLYVGSGEVRERLAECSPCRFKEPWGGDDFCMGANDGEGCGCGHHRFAKLSHKVRLAAWKCPQERFGYGRLYKLFERFCNAGC